jgi:hypothetical protein
MTLVEVLASIAILGSVLVAVSVASAELRSQEILARQKLATIALADEILSAIEDPGPSAESVPIESAPGHSYRIRASEGTDVERLGARVLLFELFSEASERAILSVELLAPDPERTLVEKEARP